MGYGFSVGPFQFLRTYFFHLIKEYAFEIYGECKHSGNCCRSIMIFDKGAPLNRVSDWSKFVRYQLNYQRFKPVVDGPNIRSYDCSCLTSNQWCSDYENRPSICHHYPMNFFYEHGYIYSSCGYNVELNTKKLQWLLPTIKRRIHAFYQPSL